jgi:hypothetical protein
LADGIRAVAAEAQGRDAPALERAEELFWGDAPVRRQSP